MDHVAFDIANCTLSAAARYAAGTEAAQSDRPFDQRQNMAGPTTYVASLGMSLPPFPRIKYFFYETAAMNKMRR